MTAEAHANALLLNDIRRRARLIGNETPGTAAWHGLRHGMMTGSRIGAVVGLSPFDSPYSTWARMAGYIGEPPETPAMRWGHLLEPVVLDQVERELGVELLRDVGTWRSRRDSWMGANPDALHHTLGIVEVKTTADPYGWGAQCADLSEPANDRVPPHYLAQVLWYMRVLGVHRGVIAVLVNGNDLRYYAIEYDKREAARLRREGLAFMESLANGDMPDIDEHGATYSAIREMHPEIDGDTVELDTWFAREAVNASAAVKAAEGYLQEMRSAIANQMGDAKYAEHAGVRIADRRAKAGGTPYVQFARNIHKIEVPA